MSKKPEMIPGSTPQPFNRPASQAEWFSDRGATIISKRNRKQIAVNERKLHQKLFQDF
jgi:hypothetical protein